MAKAKRPGTFKPGHDKRRSKGGRKPLMAEQREAARLIKEGTIRAARRVLALIDSDDEKMQFAASVKVLEFACVKETLENPWQVPDEMLDKSAAEQYAWAVRQQAQLEQLVMALGQAAEGETAAN